MLSGPRHARGTCPRACPLHCRCRSQRRNAPHVASLAVLRAAFPRNHSESATDFGCIANLGTSGCGFEMPFEAGLKALWPKNYVDADGNIRHAHDRASDEREHSGAREPCAVVHARRQARRELDGISTAALDPARERLWPKRHHPIHLPGRLRARDGRDHRRDRETTRCGLFAPAASTSPQRS
jgi:hypothetical protein